MAEDWDVYLSPVDDHPASILVDLGLIGSIPDSERPWLLRVAVALQAPDTRGLCDPEESTTLYKIEDQLFACVAKGLRARYVGRITTRGRREFFYYARSEEGFETAVQNALESFPQYRQESSADEDAAWSLCTNLLFPSDLDLQAIHNRRLVDLMERNGDDVTVPREIDHWVYFPTEESREDFIAQVQREGFQVERLIEVAAEDEEPAADQGNPDGDDTTQRYAVHLKRRDRADLQFIDPLVTDLFLRAQNLGGNYDGWGTEVSLPAD